MHIDHWPSHWRLFDARQLLATTDAGTQPHAKDQPSALRQPLSLRDPIAYLCSALSVPSCPGSTHVASWPSSTRHPVSVPAPALFRCISCALQRWHVSSASCSLYNTLGSALSVIQQPSPSHIPIRPHRPCMAASSSSRDQYEHSEDEILRFYRNLEWTTRTPPPLTVYLMPYLQDLLKRRSQTAPKPLPSDEDSGRSLRRSSQAVPSGPKPETTECRAPRTPPGAASSRDLTAKGRLPSRPRAPTQARIRSRSAAPRRPSRKPSRSSSSRGSRTPPKDPQRRLPIPRRHSGAEEDLDRGSSTHCHAAASKAAIRPQPKRYPLAPPEGLKQPAPVTQAANSSSTAPSESSDVANSPGALIDAFLKTTDAAAPRVYTACCACASQCPLLSHAIRSTFALQVNSTLVQTRAPAHFSFWQGPQIAVPCQLVIQSKATGRRSLCHTHAIRVVRLFSPNLCSDRCSHCQSSLRLSLSWPGRYHCPPFRSCRRQTTQLLLPLAAARKMLPPFSTRMRSWLPLIPQPARQCYKEWPSDQPELRAARYLAHPSRCQCMVPSWVRLKPLECAPHRHRFVVGADPRELLNNPTVRLLLPLRTQRVCRWMQITLWRSEWTPPGPSFSVSRFAFSPPRLPRLHKQPGTRMAYSLPMTKVLAPRPWQMTRATQSLKRTHSSAIAMPQLHCRSTRPCPLCALCSVLSALSLAQVDHAASSVSVFALLMGTALSSAASLNYALDLESCLAPICSQIWTSFPSGCLSSPFHRRRFSSRHPFIVCGSARPSTIHGNHTQQPTRGQPTARRLSQPDWCRSPAFTNRS